MVLAFPIKGLAPFYHFNAGNINIPIFQQVQIRLREIVSNNRYYCGLYIELGGGQAYKRCSSPQNFAGFPERCLNGIKGDASNNQQFAHSSNFGANIRFSWAIWYYVDPIVDIWENGSQHDHFLPKSAGISPQALVSHFTIGVVYLFFFSQVSARSISSNSGLFLADFFSLVPHLPFRTQPMAILESE